MIDRKLIHEIQQRKKHPPFAFWGFGIAAISILWATFNLSHDKLLLGMLEPEFSRIPEDVVSWGLLGAGLIKYLGVLTNNAFLKRAGIILLSAFWGMLFVFAITYAFGAGYPTANFILVFAMLCACIRVSRKGDFG